MEKLYLEKPTIERKEEGIKYIQEFLDYNSKIHGVGGLDDVVLENKTYEEWLEDLYKMEEKEYAESKNLVPGSTYFTVRVSDNKIVGMISLRYYLNEILKNYGGHIGYGIRPTERRKGYAKIQLYLCLLECQKLGIDKVMIDCVDTNIGSEKTIQSLGGEYERDYYLESKDITLHNYWINVDESIDKYKDDYKEKILIKK